MEKKVKFVKTLALIAACSVAVISCAAKKGNSTTEDNSSYSETSEESTSHINIGGGKPSSSSEEDEGSSYEDSESIEEVSSEETSSEETSSEEVERTYVNYIKGTKRLNNRDVPYHLVDIHLKKLSDLRTQVAVNSSNQYGTNIAQNMSGLVSSAEDLSNTSVLAAITGDFAFWSGRDGYVVRNGVKFRDSVRDTEGEDFAIFKNGTVMAYDENDYDFDEIMSMNNGCYQNWCFGPAL